MSARQQLLSHRSIRNHCNGMLEAIIYFYSRYLILDGSQKGHSQIEWNMEQDRTFFKVKLYSEE